MTLNEIMIFPICDLTALLLTFVFGEENKSLATATQMDSPTPQPNVSHKLSWIKKINNEHLSHIWNNSSSTNLSLV